MNQGPHPAVAVFQAEDHLLEEPPRLQINATVTLRQDAVKRAKEWSAGKTLRCEGCMDNFLYPAAGSGPHLYLRQLAGPSNRIEELSAVRILQRHRQVGLGQEHLKPSGKPIKS